MKVLHLIDHMELGGAQEIVKNLLNNSKDNYLFSLRNSEKINYHNKNFFISKSKSRYSFKPIIEVLKLIKLRDIKILHCHLARSQIFGYIIKKLYLPNIKLIFHEHGRIKAKSKIYNFFLKISRQQVDDYIAVSRSIKEDLVNMAEINPKKITVIYNFIDLDKFNRKNIKFNISEERNKLGIMENDFVVGFAGRLIKRKGWEDIVNLANLSTESNLKFLIAGEGEDKDKLQHKLEKLNLKEKVIYLGKVSEMDKFYSLISLFFMPSHWEPMGLTQLEAQAMQVPVIAYDIPGLNETISNQNSILIEKGNINQAREKIQDLISNKNKINKLKKEGLNNSKKYSFELFHKRLINLYKNYE